MKTLALLLLTCIGAVAQGGSYCTMSTWEPRNIKTKAGLVASYDPGNTNTLVFNGSGVSAMSNRVTVGVADLLQATAVNQPYLTNNLSGRPTLFFDGSASALQTASFTWNQPVEMLLCMKYLSYTVGDRIADGVGDSSHACQIYQGNVSPEIYLYAGSVSAPTTSLAQNTWGVLVADFNGSASRMVVNLLAPITVDAGTRNPSGFTLGSDFAEGTHAHLQVARVILASKTNAPAELGFLRWGMLKQASLY